jgi:hypothetical protein
MVNWMQAWWQVRQSLSYLRHAYRSGLSLYDGLMRVEDLLHLQPHHGFAVAYSVAHVKPRRKLMPTRY